MTMDGTIGRGGTGRGGAGPSHAGGGGRGSGPAGAGPRTTSPAPSSPVVARTASPSGPGPVVPPARFASPHHPGPPPHHHGGGRPGRRIFRGDGWWAWYPTGWVLLTSPVVCQQWSPPLDMSRSLDLIAYASEALRYSSGQPVTERLADGWVYLFTVEGGPPYQPGVPNVDPWPTVRRCWLDQGGAVGSCPPEPPAPPPPPGRIGDPSGTIGDTTSAPLVDAAQVGASSGLEQGQAGASSGQGDVPVVTRPHPRGLAGVQEGAREIGRRMVQGMRSRRVATWARNVVKAAGAQLGDRGYADPTRVVSALFAAWKQEVAFIADPVNTELMIGAEQLLCLDPRPGGCVPAGDCDDQLIGLGAAIMTCGIPVWIRLRWYKGQPQAHVVLIYDSNPRGGGPAKCIDPSVEDGQCSDAPYTTEIIIEPDSGEDSAQGVFVGIGQPGTLGAPPDRGLWTWAKGGGSGVGKVRGPATLARTGLWSWGPSAGTIGAHFVTPSDVLAYRAAWDDYVMGTARAAQACAAEYQTLASGGQSTIANVAQFAVPPDATTLQDWADIEGSYVTDITTRWNQWAGTPDSTLVLNASDILQDFQAVVMKCGQFWQPAIARDCPSIPLPQPPSVADQVQLVAHLEGIGATAAGLLQILGIGASGVLEGVGSAADWTKKKVGQIVDTATSPLLWITLALAALAAVLYFLPRGLASGVAAHKEIRRQRAAPASERRRRRARAPRSPRKRALALEIADEYARAVARGEGSYAKVLAQAIDDLGMLGDPQVERVMAGHVTSRGHRVARDWPDNHDGHVKACLSGSLPNRPESAYLTDRAKK